MTTLKLTRIKKKYIFFFKLMIPSFESQLKSPWIKLTNAIV